MENPRIVSVRRSVLGYGLAGLLLVLGVVSGASAQTAPPVVLEYWASGPPNAQVPGPWWVPLSLLNKPYETWDPKNQSKISKEKLKEFREVVAAVTNQGTSGRCDPAPDLGSSDKVSVEGVAANAAVVIHATVLSVEPGWDFPSGTVGSLVRARIETVIKGADLAVGQEVMYLRNWGVLKYGDTTLCNSVRHFGFSAESEGERFDSTDLKVVVLGRMSDFNDSLIETLSAWEFKIIQGRFVSTTGFKIVEPAEFTLDDLIQSVKGK